MLLCVYFLGVTVGGSLASARTPSSPKATVLSLYLEISSFGPSFYKTGFLV